MADPEITPSEPDGAAQSPDAGTGPTGDDIPLPEEFESGDETVAEDTASGGAPEPAGDPSDE